jgi:dCMP deaminase
MSERPTWDEYFLNMALAASIRAACTRRQVGAIIVQDNRIKASGYNGSASSAPHCTDGACPRGTQSYAEVPSFADTADGRVTNCIAIHAERNALTDFMQERPNWAEQLLHCTMYISCQPCMDCQELMTSLNLAGWVYQAEGRFVRHLRGDSHVYVGVLR